MEKAISRTSKAFLDFQEKVLASGALNQAPDLYRSLRSTVETLSLAKAIAVDQDSDGGDVQDESDHDHISASVLGRVEDHGASVDHDRSICQCCGIGSERAARDRSAQDSIGEDIQHAYRNEKSRGSDLHSCGPQAIHQIRSDHYLTHAATSVAALPPSLLEDDETDQDCIEDLTPKDPNPDIIGAAQVNGIPPGLPAKRMSEMNVKTAHALGKKKSTVQKAMGCRMRDREGASVLKSYIYSEFDFNFNS
jgi:hypothetical protein